MLNKKHNLKSRRNKDKRKGFERKNKTGNPQKRENIVKQDIATKFFDVVRFVKQKQRRNKRKERDKKESKKKTRRKKQ